MSKKRTLAFLTAFSMIISVQSGSVHADPSLQETNPEELYGIDYETDEQISENMKNWYRPQYSLENWSSRTVTDSETITCGDINVDYIYLEEYRYAPIISNKSTEVSVSNAVTSPGKLTYVDISFDGYTNFSAFNFLITYDTSVMTLVSASICKDIPETYYPNYDKSQDITDFTMNRRCVLNYLRNEFGNTDFSGERAIRLAFKVHDDAPEGKYSVSVSNMENGGLTGFISFVDEINFLGWPALPAVFKDGSITVSNTEESRTDLTSRSFNRAYAVTVYKDYITGDVDENGKINVMDLVAEKKHLLGTDDGLINTDINEDGKDNIFDLIRLSDHLLNK